MVREEVCSVCHKIIYEHDALSITETASPTVYFCSSKCRERYDKIKHNIPPLKVIHCKECGKVLEFVVFGKHYNSKRHIFHSYMTLTLPEETDADIHGLYRECSLCLDCYNPTNLYIQ